MFFIWLIISFFSLLSSLFFDRKKSNKEPIVIANGHVAQAKEPFLIAFPSTSLIFIVYVYLLKKHNNPIDFKTFIRKILENSEKFFLENEADLDYLDIIIRFPDQPAKKVKIKKFMFSLIDYLVSGKQHRNLYKLLPQLLADTFNINLVFYFENGSRGYIIAPRNSKEQTQRDSVQLLVQKDCEHFLLYNDCNFNVREIDDIFDTCLDYSCKSLYKIIQNFNNKKFEIILKGYPQGKVTKF